MLETLARNWWAVALRGVLAIIFGVITFLLPGVSLTVLAIWFGAYLLVDGVFAIISAVRAAEHHQRWGSLLLEGIVDIIGGLISVILPAIAILGFVFLVAAWALISGVVEIVAAIRLRGHILNEWLMALAGVLSIIFGVLAAIQPLVAAITIAWIIAAYAVLFGILLLGLGFRLRGWHRGQVEAPAASPTPIPPAAQ